MNTSTEERAGTIEIGGLHSEVAMRTARAFLEDLPGVQQVDVAPGGAQIRFHPDLVTAQQLYEAVKKAGFQAITFRIV